MMFPMLYIVVERYTNGARAVYERAALHGRMLPDGLRYIDSWIERDGALDESQTQRCFQLMETNDPSLFDVWTARWSDLVSFEIIPVVASVEAAQAALAQQTTVSGPVARIAQIDHVQLAMPVGREADAIAFYEDLLGIPNVPKPAALAVRGGCWFEDGELRIHLGVEADFRPAKKAHPALRVVGLPELVQRLRSHGLVVRDDEMLPGHERVYVDDPFGNRIELLEPIT